MSKKLRLAIVGTGLKAIDYAKGWLRMPVVSIVAAADTNAEARDRFVALCKQSGGPSPVLFDTVHELLESCRGEVDAVYLSTPHVFHAEGAMAIVNAGLDLLLEKPMVQTVAEAKELIAAQARTGATVVVAYQGGLSPLVQEIAQRTASGAFGQLVSVSGNIWENWAEQYRDQWKQKPEISGGGFMFDTGAHMMNTVCLLAGSEFDRVSAYMNNRGRRVDIVSAVAAQLIDGTLVTFHAVGESPFPCASQITLYFTKATVRIDAWGQWREIISSNGNVDRKEIEIVDNPLHAFIAIREERMPNHSPVELGLRVARLWDGIKASAAREGDAVTIINT